MDKKEQIKALWRQCFDDTEAFIQLFFDCVYRDENALTIEKDGQVVSALQLLPYLMTYKGSEVSVAYIYGVCTAPDKRGQGLMKQLMQKAFETMKSRDVALAILIPAEPWLFDVYRKEGFTEAFNYAPIHYHRPEENIQAPTITVMPPEVPSIDQLYAYFDRKLRERPCSILHTQDDFITILRDLELSGGQMLTALQLDESIVGMILLQPDGDKIIVKELVYDNEEIKNLLLQEATIQNKVMDAVYFISDKSDSSSSRGMVCVIDRHRLSHFEGGEMSLMLD